MCEHVGNTQPHLTQFKLLGPGLNGMYCKYAPHFYISDDAMLAEVLSPSAMPELSQDKQCQDLSHPRLRPTVQLAVAQKHGHGHSSGHCS